MSYSVTNGPISSTSGMYPDLTTDSSGLLLSTGGGTIRIVTPWASPTDNAAGYTGELRIGQISGTWYLFLCTSGTGTAPSTWQRAAFATF
jgi:hypothetical protein